jgi:hypothetical protein
MCGTEFLDAQQMSRHSDPRPVRLATLQFVKNGTMLGLSIPKRSALADRSPNTSTEGAAAQGFNERGQWRIAAGSRNHPMERGVRKDHGIEVQGGFVRKHHVDARKKTFQLDKLVSRQANGCEGSTLRFQDSANGQEIHGIGRLLQVGQESERPEQGSGIEGRDVCAVSLSSLDDTQGCQGPNAFSEGSARNAELSGEVFFNWQPSAGHEITKGEHLLDAIDHHVSLRSHRFRNGQGLRSHLTIVGPAPIGWGGTQGESWRLR